MQDCPGSKQLDVKIPHGTAGSTLRFRVNRSVVVLNDLQTGNVWLLDRAMTLMASNWADVQPKDPQKHKEYADIIHSSGQHLLAVVN